MRGATVVCLLAVGCYAPKLAPCSITCSHESPCPGELRCGNDGLCAEGELDCDELPDAPVPADAVALDSTPPGDAAPPPDASPCAAITAPSGCFLFECPEEDTCHFYCTFAPQDWNAAEALCESFGFGAKLVTIQTMVEDECIAGALGFSELPWIGLREAGTFDGFGWISGDPSMYRHWAPTNPMTSAFPDCGYMANDGLWSTEPCMTLRDRMLCETASP